MGAVPGDGPHPQLVPAAMAGHGLPPTPHLVGRDGRRRSRGSSRSRGRRLGGGWSWGRPTGDGRATAPGLGGGGTALAAIELLAQPQHFLPQQVIFGLQGITIAGDPGTGSVGSDPGSTLTTHARRHEDPYCSYWGELLRESGPTAAPDHRTRTGRTPTQPRNLRRIRPRPRPMASSSVPRPSGASGAPSPKRGLPPPGGVRPGSSCHGGRRASPGAAPRGPLLAWRRHPGSPDRCHCVRRSRSPPAASRRPRHCRRAGAPLTAH